MPLKGLTYALRFHQINIKLNPMEIILLSSYIKILNFKIKTAANNDQYKLNKYIYFVREKKVI